MTNAENMPILSDKAIKYKIQQLNILHVQSRKCPEIIAEVWLNSTDILKQNSQIYKFLANIFTQQYNP